MGKRGPDGTRCIRHKGAFGSFGQLQQTSTQQEVKQDIYGNGGAKDEAFVDIQGISMIYDIEAIPFHAARADMTPV